VKWAAASLLVAVLLVPYACGDDDGRLPDGVCGRWVTDDKHYAGRFLVITNEEICFATGEPRVNSFPIVGVEKREHDRDPQYLITYRDASGNESKLSIDLLTLSGTLRLTNRPQTIWKKFSVATHRATSEE
jgi:hypothetical protein